jgi:acyl-CoA thioester hydrolase
MRELPTYDEIQALPCGAPRIVTDDLADENGHLNVRHYLALYDDAEWVVFGGLGLGDEHAAAGLGGMFALEQHLVYRREVRVGETVTVRLRAVARTPRMLHLVSYLANDTRREVAGSMEAVDAYVEFATRRLGAFPDAGALALDELLIRAESLPWRPQLSGSMRPR